MTRDGSLVLNGVMVGTREGRWRLDVFLLGALLCEVRVTHYSRGAIPNEAVDVEETFHLWRYDVFMAHIIGARRLFWTSFLDLKSQSP